MYVKYDSNNSGGSWRLTDEDWKKLEKAGWEVKWFKDAQHRIMPVPADGRFLGALASEAIRRGLSVREAVAEWEQITGQSASDAGCACCGQPHIFTEYDDEGKWVASGPTRDYIANW